MKMHARAATIAAGLVMGLGSAIVGVSKPPPPPPPPPYNPQIVYLAHSQGGRTTNIDVSNADGRDVVSLYTTRNLTWDAKFAPNGNRVVFLEQNDIKVLTYAVTSQGVTTTSVTTIATELYTPSHVDVSPDGTELLIVEHTADPNQWAVYVMSIGGGSRLQIPVTPNVYPDAIWAHSNSRIAVVIGAPVEENFGTQTIQVIDLDAANSYSVVNVTTVFTNTVNGLYQIGRIESAHTTDTLLFSALPGTTNEGVYTLDIGAMTVSGPLVAGDSPSYSADDTTILFRGPPSSDLFTLNPTTHVQVQVTSGVLLGAPDFLP